MCPVYHAERLCQVVNNSTKPHNLYRVICFCTFIHLANSICFCENNHNVSYTLLCILSLVRTRYNYLVLRGLVKTLTITYFLIVPKITKENTEQDFSNQTLT